jgi:hypothetical protein
MQAGVERDLGLDKGIKGVRCGKYGPDLGDDPGSGLFSRGKQRDIWAWLGRLDFLRGAWSARGFADLRVGVRYV